MASSTSDGLRSAAQGLGNGASVELLGDAARLFFTARGPQLLAAIAAGATLGRAVLGAPAPSDVAVCAGIVVYWPFQEWLVHKYLLHVKPTARFDPWFARVHRAHHRTPADLKLALLPMPVLGWAMPVNVALWLLLSPTARGALTGIAASSLMTLAYEWSHFLVHTGHRPKTAWFRKVRRNHRLHHFHNEMYWYGFTATLVDTLLGTDPDPKTVAHSSTATDLHGLGGN